MAEFTLDDKTADLVHHLMEGEKKRLLHLVDRLTATGLSERQAAAVLRDEVAKVAIEFEAATFMADGDILLKERWLDVCGRVYDQYEEVMLAAHSICILGELAAERGNG